ncbi:MAG: hypothetical protein LHW64_03425 [Candidatus Cloacimonetes bacterium]|nr:hypothetical protein [Candidatus Cloacimonadota bacterium]MDY0229158.1 hypothetical protein [Candidatus Cloacimonadaceae bacterium]
MSISFCRRRVRIAVTAYLIKLCNQLHKQAKIARNAGFIRPFNQLQLVRVVTLDLISLQDLMRPASNKATDLDNKKAGFTRATGPVLCKREVCNPVALVSSSVFSVVKRIRVNPFNPPNPCDHSFVYCTHQLKLIERPDKSSVTHSTFKRISLTPSGFSFLHSSALAQIIL